MAALCFASIKYTSLSLKDCAQADSTRFYHTQVLISRARRVFIQQHTLEDAGPRRRFFFHIVASARFDALVSRPAKMIDQSGVNGFKTMPINRKAKFTAETDAQLLILSLQCRLLTLLALGLNAHFHVTRRLQTDTGIIDRSLEHTT